MPVQSVPLRPIASGVDSFEMFFSNFGGDFKKLDDLLAFVGLLFVGKFAFLTIWDIIAGFRSMIWSRLWKKNLAERYGGKWAVVTGSTDGIGEAYAHELAKNGLNIVLISRSQDKLERVAANIKSQHNVETDIIQADFKNESIYVEIESRLSDKDVAVLINNVGVMIAHPKYYEEITWDDIQGHVNVNVRAMLSMMKIVLPQMAIRKKGAIVNIASIVSQCPIPLLGIYAASKVFVNYVSESTSSEYSSFPGIDIQTVNPGYVCTNMVAFSPYLRNPNPFSPSPASFAASALSTLGYSSNTTGYPTHGLMRWFMDKCPRSLLVFCLKYQQRFLRATAKNVKE